MLIGLLILELFLLPEDKLLSSDLLLVTHVSFITLSLHPTFVVRFGIKCYGIN